MKFSVKIASLAVVSAIGFSSVLNAAPPGKDGGDHTVDSICDTFSYSDFADAVQVAHDDTDQFGFGGDVVGMWATLVDVTGEVCAVHSVSANGDNTGASAGNVAWLGSRVISAQKAFTANAFSLDTLALSTGAVYGPIKEDGSLFGLQHSNPVNATESYKGSANDYGTAEDPMVGERIGGINVFGGGVALYDGSGNKVGAVGVSGDTSCRDHAMAYRLRLAMGMDQNDGVIQLINDDGLNLVISPDLRTPFQQPICGVNDPTAHPNDNSNDDYGIRSVEALPL